MKKLKKLMAVLTAAVTVISMSLPAMADGVKPTKSDKQTATVSNVEAGATVTAYQIVKADYNDNGFIGYSAVEGVTLADVTAPTSKEITDIAQEINPGKFTGAVTMTTTATSGLADFTADLSAGSWVVIVSGNVEEVYNPMLLSVYYSISGSDNTMNQKPLDANSNWTLVTKDAYAKSTEPKVEKTIVGSGSGNSKGDDVAIGDTVNFQIDTTIPSYSDQYKEVVVKISDKLSKGLELDQNSITIDGLTDADNKDQYTIERHSDGFVITVNSDYALAHGNHPVKVTYSAKLTDEAGINFDANSNTATLDYSNDPTDSDKVKTKEDKTYHYTFGIDANLGGGSDKVTEELIKGETKKTTASETEFSPLRGATFTLTNNNTSKVYEAISDEIGHLSFPGLDAGEYTLVETKAPDGYTLNDQEIPVVITAVYNGDGTLASYSISIAGETTSTYEADYTGETTVITGESNPFPIENTKLNELPSTGGMGTYLFTIAGVAIISVAAIMLFVSKKKRV